VRIVLNILVKLRVGSGNLCETQDWVGTGLRVTAATAQDNRANER
jgi:hypothetical protein